MKELKVPSEYMLTISRIYEKFIYIVCLGHKLSYFFNTTIGIKQGCPFSPTLFGACIDELQQMVAKFVKEEDNL